jgi:predicted double-glycine peptidase
MHGWGGSAARCSAGVRRFLAPALALSLAWGTAAAAPDAPEPRGRKTVRSLQEMRQDRVVRQTWDLSCGAAALSTLLTYHLDDPVSEPEVVASVLKRTDPVKIRARQGFSLLDLKRFVVSRGHVAEGFGRLDLPHLVRLAPAIVPTSLGGYNHFVVFRGVRDGHVLLADPAFGNRTLPVDQFLSLWSRRIAFVVKPGEEDEAGVPSALRLSGRDRPPVVRAPAVREAIGVLR